MNRRQFLASAAGTLAVSAGGFRALTRTETEGYGPLGSVSVANAMDSVVDDAGETAYVAAIDGFAAVDVSDPEEPTVLAERRDLLSDREGGPIEQIWDLAVDGDRLALAGPANPRGGDALRAVALFDIGDPARPSLVAVHETDFPTHNLFLDGDRAYLTGLGEANPLIILDVADDAPREVGRWSLFDVSSEWTDVDADLRWLHDVWVRDDVAYLAMWDAGTWLVDVSDPGDPVAVGTAGGRSPEELRSVSDVGAASLELPGNHHYAMANEDATLLGVNKEAWASEKSDAEAGPGGIELWDVADPASPELLSTIEPPPTPDPTYFGASLVGFGGGSGRELGAEPSGAGFGRAEVDLDFGRGEGSGFGHAKCHTCGDGGDAVWTTSHNFDIVGDRLFSSWYQGGVKIHDIGDPANPELLAWWRQPSRTSFWTAKLATPSFFVASSFGTDYDDGDGDLYTFPNEPGEQRNPPTLTPDSTANATRTSDSTAADR